MSSALRRHRSPSLDCIRAIAILMVVLFHVATRYNAVSLDPVAQFFRFQGARGVDIFFPLSGYLISRFLLSDQPPGFVRVFFLRRMFRIVPLYMVAVTLFLAGMMITGYEAQLIDRIWIVYSFLTGWFIFTDGVSTVPYTITWSISVEEFAYVVLGLSAWVARQHLPKVLLVLGVLPVLLRAYCDVNGLYGVYYFPPTRIDSIAIGGLTAWAMLRGYPVLGPLLAALAGVMLAGLIDPLIWRSFSFTMITLGTCIAIVLCETRLRHLDGWLVRVGADIGFYSYYTYLFHFFTIYGMFFAVEALGLGTIPFWVMAVLCMALTHAQAVLSHRYFEGPLMRYGRSLEPALSRTPARQ